MKVLQILSLMFGLFVFANAQNTLLTGTVYDEKGAVIQNASIKAVARIGKEYLAIPNEDGVYNIKLPVGIYTIEFSANLFETFTIKNYRVSPGYQGKFNLDIALEVAHIGDCGLKELETQKNHHQKIKTKNQKS